MTSFSLKGLRGGEELAAAVRSALYHRLAEAFGFPADELLEAVASGRFLSELLAEAAALPFELPIEGETRAALAGGGGLEQEYIRLFEVGPGRPPCPLYEGSHRDGRMKIMEELVRFYEHFGLQPDPGDQPDHLCAELEFMHYLAFKEAAALSRPGPAGAFRLAQRDFLARHLCRWLPRLRLRLETLEPPPFYRALAAVAEAFAAADLASLKRSRAKPDTELVSLPD
jgi:DMSO reductase family type II enzyme chaperone